MDSLTRQLHMPPGNRLPAAVIFDWAGTLVDHGSHAPVRALVRLFGRYGVTLTTVQARGPMGLHKRAHIQRILDLPAVAAALRSAKGGMTVTADGLYAQFVGVQREEVRACAEWVPGAPSMLMALRQRGILVGSCTGYSLDMMDPLIEMATTEGVAPDCIVTASDVPRGRPAPDMIFEACRRLGVDPNLQWVVKVGDTLEDIREGVNAGVDSVGVTDTGNEMGMSLKDLVMSELDDHRAGISTVSDRRRQIVDAMTGAGARATVRSVVQLPSVLCALVQK